MARLQVDLDSPLPAELAIGGGTAVFVAGTCFDAELRIQTLEFELDGVRQPVMAYGMPRLDHFRALHPTLDPYAAGGLRNDPSSL